MRLAAVALALAAGSAGITGAASAHGVRVSCRSGRTLFRSHGVRAFLITSYFAERGYRSPYQTFYVCRPHSPRPRAIFDGDPFTRAEASGFRVFGVRLGFVIHSEGFSNGSATWVGWLDLRIGRLRVGLINAGENAEPGEPLVLDSYVTFAIADDGAVAVMGSEAARGSLQQEVDLLEVAANALGPPKPLFMTSRGGLDPSSIAITGTSVTWRTATGQVQSVPR